MIRGALKTFFYINNYRYKDSEIILFNRFVNQICEKGASFIREMSAVTQLKDDINFPHF
jgi:hypothetical protein